MRGFITKSTIPVLSVAAMAFAGVVAAGDMKPMSNEEMSEVSGKGVGIVMEDFRFSAQHDPDAGKTFKLTGITNSAGEDVEVLVNNLFIGGAGSDFGNNLQTFNLGRLTNPFSLELLDGNTVAADAGYENTDTPINGKALLELSAPDKVAQADGVACLPGGSDTGCVSRAPDSSNDVRGERMDLGVATTIQSGSSDPQNLNIHAQSAVVDGSHIRLFGADSPDGTERLGMQIQANFYTPKLSINACDETGADCGESIAFNDFMMELTLGNAIQPLFVSVLGVNQDSPENNGNLRVELQNITDVRSPDSINDSGTGSSDGNKTFEFYQDYYTNPDNRSDIRVGNVEIGDESVGGARIDGMLFQHLETTFRSLD